MHYRLYVLDSRGHISSATDLDCGDDEQAWDVVQELVADITVELWQSARLVGRRKLTERGWEAVETPKLAQLVKLADNIVFIPKMTDR